jgi:hypothetical protein
MVLPIEGKWEHEGPSTGTIGDGPTVVAEDDTVVPLTVCRPGDTSVEHS